MNEKNKIIISIIAVIAIIVAVVGATYAYWTWTTNESERTIINFTYEPNLSATLSGGTLTVSKIAPTTSCTGTYATKVPVTLKYSNGSGSPAVAKGTLTVTAWTVQSGRSAFQTGDLAHLHYALTTSNSNCTTGAISGATGTFDGKGSAGSVLFSNVVLQDNIATGTSDATKTMYLYVWLDGDYEFQNVGSGAVQDPMQDLSFTLTWSGQITNNLS